MSNYQHERGWLDSEVWGDAPYDERAAWSWMIGEAAWKDCVRGVNGHPVPIKRGSFTASLRFMAQKWQWDKNKVNRFIKKLEAWNMIKIGTDNGTGQTFITICNYETYQTKKGKSETVNDTTTGQMRDSGGTEAGQTRNQSNQSNQYIHQTEFENEFWPRAEKKVGKDAAAKAYAKARGRAAKEEILQPWRAMNTLWAQKKNSAEWKYIPHPATWLNEGRWKDETPKPTSAGVHFL